MRVAGLALVSMFILAGCAVPPAVSVASFVADGVSYVVTGKSTTDHAISAVMREDCALLRAAKGEDICDPDGEVLVELVGDGPSERDWQDAGDPYAQNPAQETAWQSVRKIETVQVPY